MLPVCMQLLAAVPCVCVDLCGFLRVSGSREYDPCTVRSGSMHAPAYMHATSREISSLPRIGGASGTVVVFSSRIIHSSSLASFLGSTKLTNLLLVSKRSLLSERKKRLPLFLSLEL